MHVVSLVPIHWQEINADLLWIRALGTNLNEFLIKIQNNYWKKNRNVVWKISTILFDPQSLMCCQIHKILAVILRDIIRFLKH